MKRFLSILSLVILGLVSTSCYDDTEIREAIDDLDGRVQTLETLCTELNTNLTALSTLVQALQKGDYVVSVSPLMEDGEEVGYRIIFKESGVVDLYHGQDGADGKDGENGKDGADGEDGQDGEDGITPHIGANGNWFVGETDTGVKAQGEDGDPGDTPQKGVDYWTAADKSGIVADVLAALPTWEGGSY